MLLVKNARILTMSGRDYDNGYILADKGKIIGLGGDCAEGERLAGAGGSFDTVDAGGGFAVPGFIDAHCAAQIMLNIGFEPARHWVNPAQ